MKRVLKIFTVIFVAVVFSLLAFLLSIPVVNDAVAAKIADTVEGIPLPPETEFCEKVSRAGKLAGNGNGMQYFGGILIKSDLTASQLEAYYAACDSNGLNCVVQRQAGQGLHMIEHAKAAWGTQIDDGQYYTVYAWGDGNSLFSELDFRGY